MQNEQTLEQMIREYETMMPPEIMDIIKAFDWKREVRTIVNQNQLMIDVGADLEQSIYLMILGAVKVEDLYERLTDTHELPDDKARKIIQEIEMAIFNPLHKKLMDLDKEDSSSMEESSSKSDNERNSMLAEIEKETEPISKPAPKFDPSKINQNPKNEEQNSGITKPFSINPTKTIDVKEQELASGPVAQGVQEDPVATSLTQTTVVQKPKNAIDPYREPIE